MTEFRPPPCHWCKRLLGLRTPDRRGTCGAYPLGIPPAIWWEGYDHRQPYRGDDGLLFEQDPDKEPLPVELYNLVDGQS